MIRYSKEIIIIEKGGLHRISVEQISYPSSLDMSLDKLSIVIVENSNTLVLLDRKGRTKWRWISNQGNIRFPYIKKDNSVIAVVGITILYHFSMEGEILDSWEIAPGIRLEIIGQLDDNNLLVTASSMVNIPAHIIVDTHTRSVTRLANSEDSYVVSNEIMASPYLVFSSGKIAAVAPSGLVDKPRFPRPKCGKFLRLPEGNVGIYSQHQELIAADSKGKKLWNLNIPFDPRYLLFGMHHVAVKNKRKILVWNARA